MRLRPKRFDRANRIRGPPKSNTLTEHYPPYGSIDVSQGVMAATESELGYTGARRLTGDLVFLNARVYDPRMRRFLQPDDVDLIRYTYVTGDPINRTDPTGHQGHPGGMHNPENLPNRGGRYNPVSKSWGVPDPMWLKLTWNDWYQAKGFRMFRAFEEMERRMAAFDVLDAIDIYMNMLEKGGVKIEDRAVFKEALIEAATSDDPGMISTLVQHPEEAVDYVLAKPELSPIPCGGDCPKDGPIEAVVKILGFGATAAKAYVVSETMGKLPLTAIFGGGGAGAGAGVAAGGVASAGIVGLGIGTGARWLGEKTSGGYTIADWILLNQQWWPDTKREILETFGERKEGRR